MNNRTMAIVSYITLIGWIISYVSYSKAEKRSDLVRYHLNQSLGIIIFSFVLGFAGVILVGILPMLATVFYIVSLAPFILMLLGIITASNEAMRPVPVIGKFIEGKIIR